MAVAKQQNCTDPSSFIDPTAATIDEEEVRGQVSAMEKVEKVWKEACDLDKCKGYLVDRLRASLGIEVNNRFFLLGLQCYAAIGTLEPGTLEPGTWLP